MPAINDSWLKPFELILIPQSFNDLVDRSVVVCKGGVFANEKGVMFVGVGQSFFTSGIARLGFVGKDFAHVCICCPGFS